MATLTANDLRKLAEEADGTRGEDIYFVLKEGELVRAAKQPTSGVLYLTVNTKWNGEGLQGTDQIKLDRGQVSPTADALFTSQSSFEKFALPYYIRTMRPDDLKEKLEKLYAADVIAVEHEPGSDVDGVESFHGITPTGRFRLI